jgi:hypothetical protein
MAIFDILRGGCRLESAINRGLRLTVKAHPDISL